ncbi:hypothetical protein F5888DRAFT_1618085 [Russula emetica]|nr:hypothetical protein F5888DRAFT_1618085 [Russula emetica]
MATNRKRDDDKPVVHSTDDLRTLLSSAITSHDSAEIALLHIMKTHNFTLPAYHIDASLSSVHYEDIAPFVGLQPDLNMTDIKTFALHRSRIPTALFKSIVQDIDVMLVQYGPPIEHETEEATSQFLSPIFNRLIAVFCFAFRNLPESTIERRATTKRRVEYHFQAIGSISVLFIEVKLRIGSRKERLDAVAQVIAECDGQAYS